MKTIEQIEAEIAQLQRDLEQLKNPPKPIIERTETYNSINSFFETSCDSDDKTTIDDEYFSLYNYYPADGVLCKQVANYLKRTHLFTRKAIEFADGYEFKKRGTNWFVYFCTTHGQFDKACRSMCNNPNTIYLDLESADALADWCNAHKRELGYD